MAVIQRRIPAPLAMPVGIVSPRADARMRVGQQIASWSGPIAVALVAALGMVAQVNGYARMTGLNFQRVRLNQQLKSLQTEQQLISSEIIRIRQKDEIEAWAVRNGMSRSTALPFVIHVGKTPEGR